MAKQKKLPSIMETKTKQGVHKKQFQNNLANGSGQAKAFAENSLNAQRILVWLNSSPLTTLEARLHLDILHPAARIMELRNKGYNIQTIWCEDLSSTGKFHRVARYILKRG